MLQLLQLSGFDAASAGSVARFMASKLLSVSAAVLRVAVGQSSVVSRKSAPVNREADGQIHYAALRMISEVKYSLGATTSVATVQVAERPAASRVRRAAVLPLALRQCSSSHNSKLDRTLGINGSRPTTSQSDQMKAASGVVS